MRGLDLRANCPANKLCMSSWRTSAMKTCVLALLALSAGALAGRRAGLARQAGADRRAVRGRRDAGHHHAADRRTAAGEIEADVRGRKPAGRQRQSRHRCRSPRRRPTARPIGISILGPLGLNTLLFAKMPYDPFTDLALVTRLTDQPSVLAVNADVPARSTRRAGRAAQARARQVQFRLDRQRLAVASRDGGGRASRAARSSCTFPIGSRRRR